MAVVPAGNGNLMVTPVATSAPNIVTSTGNDFQGQMLQAMLANIAKTDPQTAAALQASIAQQARMAANRYYLDATRRKVAPCLTNGAVTQAYVLGTPLTFNVPTSLNGFAEGIIIRATVNYTLATGTSATYAPTAAGLLGLIDSFELRYNKSMHKMYPITYKYLAQMGMLEDYVVPEAVFGGGQSQSYVQNYLNGGLPTAVGANTAVFEQFFPFDPLNGYNDVRGLLPIMVGDTGLQVIINTPQAILGSDPRMCAIYPSGGTGNAISAISGTVEVEVVYRDGDAYMGTSKVPFDLSAVSGTVQQQIDSVLQPLIAGGYQRQKLQIMGQHYATLAFLIDGLQSNVYSNLSNLSYLEIAKDGVGGNTFERYGAQTNLDIRDWLYLRRLDFKQDLDQGVYPLVEGPVIRQGDPHIRKGVQYLDNTRTGWPDWRYCLSPTSIGTGTLNGFPCNPRIEVVTIYVNPTGLVPV